MPFDRRASMKSQVIFWRWLGQLESEPKGTNENMSWNWLHAEQTCWSVLWILLFFFHPVNIYWLPSMHQTVSWALEIQPVKLPVQWGMAQWLWLSLFLPSPMTSIFGPLLSVAILSVLLHQPCWGHGLTKAFIIPQSHSSPEATSTLHLKCFWFPLLQTLSRILTLMEVSSVLYSFFLN